MIRNLGLLRLGSRLRGIWQTGASGIATEKGIATGIVTGNGKEIPEIGSGIGNETVTVTVIVAASASGAARGPGAGAPTAAEIVGSLAGAGDTVRNP